MKRSTTGVLLLCLTALAGCRGPAGAEDKHFSPIGKLANPLEWGVNSDEPRSGTPERVVATWVDTVRNQSGQPAERGFGGRIYFYDRSPDPITIDGRLVVYAFEEEGRKATDHKPTRRYIFPADQLAHHMSQSEMGPSYSLWLPWGSVDGTPTRVSLIARFEPTRGGGLVVSDQATQALPGQGVAAPDTGQELLAGRPSDGVRQVAFDEPSTKNATPVAPDESRARLSTTTIRLRR